jgi:hypothetical protein
VPQCEIDIACKKIQSWIDEASEKEASGQALGCGDIDDRLIAGLSVIETAGAICSLDWPSPQYLREYGQLRLQQTTKKTTDYGVRVVAQEVKERIAAVLHCEIPIRCLPLCVVDVQQPPVVAPPSPPPAVIVSPDTEQPQPAEQPVEPPFQLGWIVPHCLPRCALDAACSKIQEWVDEASDKENAGQTLTCADMDHRLTEGLSVMGPDDQCFIDFPSPRHIRWLRRLQKMIEAKRLAAEQAAQQEGEDDEAGEDELPDGQAEGQAEAQAEAAAEGGNDVADPAAAEQEAQQEEEQEQEDQAGGDAAASFTQTLTKSKLGIAISREILIQRISAVLHCNIPVPCVPICEPRAIIVLPQPTIYEPPTEVPVHLVAPTLTGSGAWGEPTKDAPQEGAPQEGAPQEGAPQEGAPQEGAPQEGAPQGAPQEPPQGIAVGEPTPGGEPQAPQEEPKGEEPPQEPKAEPAPGEA